MIGVERMHGPNEQTEANPAQPRERLEDAGETPSTSADQLFGETRTWWARN